MRVGRGDFCGGQGPMGSWNYCASRSSIWRMVRMGMTTSSLLRVSRIRVVSTIATCITTITIIIIMIMIIGVIVIMIHYRRSRSGWNCGTNKIQRRTHSPRWGRFHDHRTVMLLSSDRGTGAESAGRTTMMKLICGVMITIAARAGSNSVRTRGVGSIGHLKNMATIG